jgi:hypothetical protein
LHEKNSAIYECERHIRELESIISDRKREIVNTNAKLQQAEQKFDVENEIFLLNLISFSFYQIQQRELEDYRQKRDILNVNLNIALEENEVCKSNETSKILFFFLGLFRSNKNPRKTIRNVSSKLNPSFFLYSNFSIRIEITHPNKSLIIKISSKI